MNTLKIHRKKIRICTISIISMLILLACRLLYIMVFLSEELSEKATMLHQRERSIKAERGKIISSDGYVLADNKTVCTVSVIHSQIENPEKIISVLSKELEVPADRVRKYVEKVSSMERIKSNVSKEIGDRIRNYNLPGVKVDEDSKRYYPYNELASKVLGFTGGDNQGIVGIESRYESVLKGINGQILTMTDATGKELENEATDRIEPIPGNDLHVSIDYSIQSYCEQAAMKAYEAKDAKSVSVIVMNPQNGEIYAMVNYPEYDLNRPYELNYSVDRDLSEREKMELLNSMWRNGITNDTYEPGSTFKTITATAALSLGVVSEKDHFTCTGRTTVSNRTIKCHKTTGHGAQTFAETLMNSCNPAFINWGMRVGKENFLFYMKKLGLLSKTGIDLPGEATTIMHKTEDIKDLELATMSFGQSFQITPLQLLRAVSCVINGGTLVTPHIGIKKVDADGNEDIFQYNTEKNVLSSSVCDTMKKLLRKVVAEGGGQKCNIEGYSIGGKTATSQKLPRSAQKYISSFIGFAPAENPQVLAMCIIDEPQGVYYGGTIATPVIREIFENILPYLGIEKSDGKG
ncbi:MAG: penicillin-binding transpeptidase domain-containing protein [Butyrivibrio sp.]|nr:penicillin-binding transpeptidase domain-containing protein [Butyrivibrio sp.]